MTYFKSHKLSSMYSPQSTPKQLPVSAFDALQSSSQLDWRHMIMNNPTWLSSISYAWKKKQEYWSSKFEVYKPLTFSIPILFTPTWFFSTCGKSCKGAFLSSCGECHGGRHIKTQHFFGKKVKSRCYGRVNKILANKNMSSCRNHNFWVLHQYSQYPSATCQLHVVCK